MNQLCTLASVRRWRHALVWTFFLLMSAGFTSVLAQMQKFESQSINAAFNEPIPTLERMKSSLYQTLINKKSVSRIESATIRKQSGANPDARRLIPGTALGGGMYSVARAPRQTPLQEGTYEKGAIYLKTRERFIMGKGATRFQSSTLMSSLEGVVVREIRPISTPHNSGALLASDDFGIGRIYAVRFDPGVDVQRLCAELSRNPEVEYAEPIYIYQLSQERVTPNDPLFARQYHWARIEAERAWGVTRGDSTVVIAICDSGVDIEHEDLKDNIWHNPGETGLDAMGRDKRSNGVDDDNNGKVDDWRGWDFIGNVTAADRNASIYRPDNDPKPRPFRELDPEDGLNHGSHVAGIAGATPNNGRGGLGSGFRCRILPIKNATEDLPNARSVILGYEGILYAAQMGASVVNCSWGGASGFSQAAQDIVNAATAMGTLVVAAAGNSGQLMDDLFTPATLDNVLSVGASDENDLPAEFSNFGVKTTVFAPGDNILSTVNADRYFKYSGTSMASPLVAGVAALVRSLHPNWTPQQVIAQIRGTSDNVLIPGGTVRPAGFFGRLNAYKALSVNRTFTSGERLPGIVSAGNSIEANSGVLTSFEPRRFILSVRNILADAEDVSVTLKPIDGTILALTPTVTLGSLRSGERKDVEFTLQVQPEALSGSGLRTGDFIVEYRSGSYTNYERLSIPYRIPSSSSAPQLVVSSELNLGATPVTTTATFRITNTGNQVIRITAATQSAFSGPHASEFSFVTDLNGTDLDPGASIQPRIRFTPRDTSLGAREASVRINAMSTGVVPSAGVGGSPISSGYAFSQRVETYTEITDNNFPFSAGGAGLDDGEFDADLPFPFRFGEKTFTNVRINSNGFLIFAPQRSAISSAGFVDLPLGDPTFGADGVISGFGNDLFMRADGSIRFATQGSAPNRVFVVQWQRASFYTPSGPSPLLNLNFQIRLYEGTNRVEIAFGTMRLDPPAEFVSGQVGLRGTVTNDFNARLIDVREHTWLTSVGAPDAESDCELAPDNFPPVGLVFAFTPGDFTAAALPRIVAFQRDVALKARARRGGVLMTIPSPAAGLNFNTTNRIGGTAISITPVTVGTVRTLTVTLANISPNPMTITELGITPVPDGAENEFRVLAQVPITVPANSTTGVQIAFAPSVARFRETNLRIGYDGETTLLPIYGTGESPQDRLRFYFNDTGVDLTGTTGVFSRFDRLPPFTLGGSLPPESLVPIGTRRIVNTISVRNMTNEPVTVNEGFFVLATANSVQTTEFKLLTPLPFTVQPGTQRQLSIEYAPIEAGEKLVDLVLRSDNANPAVLRCGSVGAIPRAISVTTRTNNAIINSIPSPFTFSFGLVRTDTTVTRQLTLRNSSTSTLIISAVDFGGLHGSDFSVNTSLPIRINFNQTTTLSVSFKPGDVGVRTGVMTLTHNLAPGRESVHFIGSGNALKRIALPLSTLIFRTTAPGATSPTISVAVRNAGRETVRVSSVRIEGKNADDFRFVRNIPDGSTIATTQTSTATVLFAPSSNGVKEARLVVRSDAEFPEMSVPLLGLGADSVARATLVTQDQTAQLGDEITVPIILRGLSTLPANTRIYANVRTNASMLQPLDELSTGSVFDNQRVVRLTLNPTQGGDSVVARLRYRTTLGNDTTTIFRIEDAYAENAAIAAISGRLTVTGAPQAFLQAPPLENARYLAQQGETVSVPIVLKNRHRIPAGKLMLASLSYNASLLEPTSLPSFTTSNGVQNAQRTIIFAIPPGAAADTVITPTFRAAIGNADSTIIQVNNRIQILDAQAGDLVFIQRPGSFKLTNLNESGGTQLFFSSGARLAIVSVSPNPSAAEALSVTIRTEETGEVYFTLSDMSGKTLREERLNILRAGLHAARIGLEGLPSGSYLLTARSLAGKATQTIQIIR